MPSNKDTEKWAKFTSSTGRCATCEHCGSKSGLSDFLIAVLKRSPGRPIADLSVDLYDENTKEARAKTRALLSQLQRLGFTRRVSEGRWEALYL